MGKAPISTPNTIRTIDQCQIRHQLNYNSKKLSELHKTSISVLGEYISFWKEVSIRAFKLSRGGMKLIMFDVLMLCNARLYLELGHIAFSGKNDITRLGLPRYRLFQNFTSLSPAFKDPQKILPPVLLFHTPRLTLSGSENLASLLLPVCFVFKGNGSRGPMNGKN
ncbi:hypothetical protein YC2023_056694 [Brassica napus]